MKMARLLLIAVGVFAGIFLVFGAIGMFSEIVSEFNQRSFGLSEEELSALADQSRYSTASQDGSKPELRGKILVLATQNNGNSFFGASRSRSAPCIDDLHKKLPKDLSASSVNEANTLVLLSWFQIHKHGYEDGSNGYQEGCRVDFVDLNSKTLVESETVLGSEPPDFIRTRSGSPITVYGTGCGEAVVAHIISRVK